MIYKQKKTIHIVLAFIIISLITLLISSFIKIPYRIKTYSEVFPKEKWLLTRGNGGELISNVLDYTKGYTTIYNLSQFERGEFISLNLNKFLKDKKELSKGDTIAVLQSSNVQDQLISAEGELDVAIANLKSQSSGQKEELIIEAENKIKYTNEKLAGQKILYDRAKQLLDKGIISQQEYELQKWTFDLLEIEQKIFNAQLENIRTGVKPEDIKFLESQIAAIKNKLTFLKNWESNLIIVSPIDGRITASLSPDTLLNAVNTNEIVLHSPIKIFDLPEFSEGGSLKLSFANIDGNFSGKILNINREVKIVSGEQAVFISILLDNKPGNVLPGMIIESSLILNDVTLFDYLIRLITN
ncbi:MAG: hypothetical protein AB1521_02495 [Bacteroidota bacterium]